MQTYIYQDIKYHPSLLYIYILECWFQIMHMPIQIWKEVNWTIYWNPNRVPGSEVMSSFDFGHSSRRMLGSRTAGAFSPRIFPSLPNFAGWPLPSLWWNRCSFHLHLFGCGWVWAWFLQETCSLKKFHFRTTVWTCHVVYIPQIEIYYNSSAWVDPVLHVSKFNSDVSLVDLCMIPFSSPSLLIHI